MQTELIVHCSQVISCGGVTEDRVNSNDSVRKDNQNSYAE